MTVTKTKSKTRTTCPYCGVGCGIVAEVEKEKLIAVAGDTQHPANFGRLCIKGTSLPDTQYGAARLLNPRVDGRQEGWCTAIGEVARRLQQTIDEHGADSVAFYLSGQLLTEDYYVANKLMKGFIGSSNVDTNSRLCMASAVAAHKRAFGEDVVPCSYSDIEEASLFVLVGSNTAWAHPVIYQRICDAVRDRGARVIVIDPRRTATCDIADMHLPIRSGTDVMLFDGLVSHIFDNQLTDRKFVEQHLAGLEHTSVDIDQVSAATGVSRDLILNFYQSFGENEKVITMFSQGINQSVDGTDKCNAIINCHLITGRIGRPGMGPFSLTGQPNAMGGREVGGMSNQLAAHMGYEPDDLDRVQRFWNAPNMARRPGRMAVDLFDGVREGKIKAIWIMGTNPAVSLPDSAIVEKALKTCPLVIVSDTVTNTDTTEHADILLPAAGWGEKDGTVTNSERRISRQRAFLPAPGEARPDWSIICEVARVMGFTEAFSYSSVHEIFSEHAALSGFENHGDRLFDISSLSGLNKTEYDALAPFSWPIDERPFARKNYQHAENKARYVAVNRESNNESDNPYLLNTGRLRDQWHTMTRTGTSAKLFQHQRHPWLEVSQEDADKNSLQDGDLVLLENGKVQVHVPVRISGQVKAGELFIPMHWNQTVSSLTVNALVPPDIDPISGQPALKAARVSLERAEVTAWIRVISRRPLGRDLLDPAMFWTVTPTSNAHLYDMALGNSDIEAILNGLELNCPSSGRYRYHDSSTQELRVIAYDGDAALWMVLHSPGTRLMAEQMDALPVHVNWHDLSALSQANRDTSGCICTCYEVTENRIREAIINGAASLSDLGKRLRCGTNCGSCIPEINRLIESESENMLGATGTES